MEMICINCPMGCVMEVDHTAEGTQVTGNTCPRGKSYAHKECTNPTRIVTTSVYVEGGSEPIVSVKTQTDIPKDKIFEVLSVLKEVRLKAPVVIGDVVVENIADTGVSIVATKNNF